MSTSGATVTSNPESSVSPKRTVRESSTCPFSVASCRSRDGQDKFEKSSPFISEGVSGIRCIPDLLAGSAVASAVRGMAGTQSCFHGAENGQIAARMFCSASSASRIRANCPDACKSLQSASTRAAWRANIESGARPDDCPRRTEGSGGAASVAEWDAASASGSSLV